MVDAPSSLNDGYLDEKERNRELAQEIARERSHSSELERETGRLKQAREAGRAGISGGFVSPRAHARA